jgi:hypothetical protein
MKNTHAKTLLLSALLLPLTACGTTVLGGGGGGGGGDDAPPPASGTSSSTTVGTATSTGSSTSPPGGGTSAIAILLADLPSAHAPGAPIVWTGAGAAPAGALVLMWSNESESCGAAYIEPSASGLVWQGALVLPPELLQVGLVDLSGPGVGSFTYNYFAASGGGGGGGPSMSGMLDIVSIDATSITVNLITGLSAWGGGTENGVTYPPVVLQGTYTIPRC